MNTNLTTATDIDVVQATVAFEPSVQPLDAHPPVINGLPLWCFDGPSRGLLNGKRWSFYTTPSAHGRVGGIIGSQGTFPQVPGR